MKGLLALCSLSLLLCLSPARAHADIASFLVGGYDFHVVNNCNAKIVLGLHESNETTWYLLSAGERNYLNDSSGERKTTGQSAILLYVERSDSIGGTIDPEALNPNPEGYIARIVSGTTEKTHTITTYYGKPLDFVEYRDTGITFDIEVDCYDRVADRMCRRAIELRANLCGYDCRRESAMPKTSTYEYESEDKRDKTTIVTQTRCPECRSCIVGCMSEFEPYQDCSGSLQEMRLEHIARGLQEPKTYVEEVEVVGPGHEYYIDPEIAIRDF